MPEPRDLPEDTCLGCGAPRGTRCASTCESNRREPKRPRQYVATRAEIRKGLRSER